MHKDKSQEWRDGYITAKQEYFAEKARGGKHGGKARWAGTTLEDRVEHARMMSRKGREARAKKKAERSHTDKA